MLVVVVLWLLPGGTEQLTHSLDIRLSSIGSTVMTGLGPAPDAASVMDAPPAWRRMGGRSLRQYELRPVVMGPYMCMLEICMSELMCMHLTRIWSLTRLMTAGARGQCLHARLISECHSLPC